MPWRSGGLLWGMYLTWPPRAPKGSPKGSPKVPKDVPKGPQSLPKGSQSPPQTTQGIHKGTQRLQKDVPEVILRVRGEYLRWFPPYMKKAPSSPNASSVLERLRRLRHMLLLMTVSTFRLILAPWQIIGKAFFGYVYNMASRGGPRVPKGYPRR